MENQKSSTIFINPKFKNAYINPNFLKNTASATQIHLNPKFIHQQQVHNAQMPIKQELASIPQKKEISNVNSNAIIKNTKRSLVRVPAVLENNQSSREKALSAPTSYSNNMNLIKISKTKLVKASHLMKNQQIENEAIKNATESLIKSKKEKVNATESIYKLDRRKLGAGSIQKKKNEIDLGLSPKKFRQSIISSKGFLNSPSSKLKAIRGQTFILSKSGKKLHRKNENSLSSSQTFNAVKGKTWKRSLSNSLNEQDKSQQIRNHLVLAKTKSISVLHRTTSSSSKTNNIICPIYRRIGKCLAYAKGKCSKVHDQRYVIVCPNFIRGLCKNDKCLLSHNANLHKMPVCKYYLQGTCLKSNDECLYLHKKVSDGTKLCGEFLKGYCPLADKCNLLHDHIESDRKKYSVVRNQQAIKKKRKEAEIPKKIKISKPAESRYFEDVAPSPSAQQNIPKYTKTAPLLPDFIKL